MRGRHQPRSVFVAAPSSFHARPFSFKPPISTCTTTRTAATTLVTATLLSPSTSLLLADVQSFRDAFRTLFVPGVSIVTFVLPLLFIGLFTQRQASSNTKEEDTTIPQAPASAAVPPRTASSPDVVWAWKLLACIVIDLIGDGSLIVPGVGDASDFLWAPLSAVLVRLLFGNNVIAAVNFLEEILPFTDVIPTATIAFVIEYFFRHAEQEDSVVVDLQNKKAPPSRRRRMDKDVLDVKATVIRDDDF